MKKNSVWFCTDGEDYKNGEIISPKWKINESLKNAVYDGMSIDLSIEERAFYIYFKLCKLLRFDEKTIYETHFDNDIGFNQEILETVKPGSLISCAIISRLFYGFINELNDRRIKAYLYFDGFHIYTGFKTDKINVELDPTKINELKKSNDLLNLKIGSIPDGINIRNGFDNYKKIILSVYAKVYGQQPKKLVDKLKELRKLAKDDDKDDKTDEIQLEQELRSFCKIMKENEVCGNEAVSALVNYIEYGFFGKNIEFALCAEYKFGIYHERKVILRTKDDEQIYFVFNTGTLNYEQISKNELVRKLNNKDFKPEPSKNNKQARKFQGLLK